MAVNPLQTRGIRTEKSWLVAGNGRCAGGWDASVLRYRSEGDSERGRKEERSVYESHGFLLDKNCAFALLCLHSCGLDGQDGLAQSGCCPYPGEQLRTRMVMTWRSALSLARGRKKKEDPRAPLAACANCSLSYVVRTAGRWGSRALALSNLGVAHICDQTTERQTVV